MRGKKHWIENTKNKIGQLFLNYS